MAFNLQAAVDAAVNAAMSAAVAPLNAKIAQQAATIADLTAKLAAATAPAPAPAPTTPIWPPVELTAATTGAKGALTPYTGPLTILADNVVVENKTIDGALHITGKNAVIRNCKITYNDYWGIDAEVAVNTTIERCTIVGPGYNGQSPGAILSSGNIIGCDISGAEHAIVVKDQPTVIRGNFIHDGGRSGTDPHIGGLSLKGGNYHVLIEGNTIIGKDTSCITLQDYFNPIDDVMIRGNICRGTRYVIYVEGRFGHGTTNVSIIGNVLKAGDSGYYFSFAEAAPIVTGNIDYDTGKPIVA